MRLVTNNPLEYLAWLGIAVLAVGVLLGVCFLVAWFQVYVLPNFKRKRK